jgi:hypothetical protein
MVSPFCREDDCFLSQVGQVSFLLNKKGASGSLECKMVSPSSREDDCFLSQVGQVSLLPNKNGAARSIECKMVSSSGREDACFLSRVGQVSFLLTQEQGGRQPRVQDALPLCQGGRLLLVTSGPGKLSAQTGTGRPAA